MDAVGSWSIAVANKIPRSIHDISQQIIMVLPMYPASAIAAVISEFYVLYCFKKISVSISTLPRSRILTMIY